MTRRLAIAATLAGIAVSSFRSSASTLPSKILLSFDLGAGTTASYEPCTATAQCIAGDACQVVVANEISMCCPNIGNGVKLADQVNCTNPGGSVYCCSGNCQNVDGTQRQACCIPNSGGSTAGPCGLESNGIYPACCTGRCDLPINNCCSGVQEGCFTSPTVCCGATGANPQLSCNQNSICCLTAEVTCTANEDCCSGSCNLITHKCDCIAPQGLGCGQATDCCQSIPAFPASCSQVAPKGQCLGMPGDPCTVVGDCIANTYCEEAVSEGTPPFVKGGITCGASYCCDKGLAIDCISDSQCCPGYYCNTTTHVCTAQATTQVACTANDQCLDGCNLNRDDHRTSYKHCYVVAGTPMGVCPNPGGACNTQYTCEELCNIPDFGWCCVPTGGGPCTTLNEANCCSGVCVNGSCT
jgi:hypothetical protein